MVKRIMMDECLESGIVLYTLNFATARPTAFTSVSTQTRLNYTTVRQLLIVHGRRAERVKFVFHSSAAGPYTGVLLEVQRDLTGFLTLFPNGWEFLVQFSQVYYMFLSTLDCAFYSIISNFDEVMPY